MKKTLLIFLLAGATLVAGWSMISPQRDSVVPEPQNITKGPDLLRQYLSVIEGSWINEGYYLGVEEGEILTERKADLMIEIDPSKTLGGQALVVVSEYCRPEMVQYLHFELVFDHLEFVGASTDGCFFDMPMIDYMEIRFEVEGNDTILIYEAQEMEYEFQQSERMRRATHQLSTPEAWSCGLQAYLEAIFEQDHFELYTAAGELVSPEEAFGLTAFRDDLEYLSAFSYFWPGYEEMCVRADMEVVMIGGSSPGADLQIYAIEWDMDEIRLYETNLSSESDDAAFPVEKGKLAFTIVPFEVRSAPDL